MFNKKNRKHEFVSTLRYGHLLIPIFLHAPFRDVSHTPSLFAASFKGSMKCSCGQEHWSRLVAEAVDLLGSWHDFVEFGCFGHCVAGD